MSESEETCLGCIPLRTGVWVIAILQAINSGIRLIPGLDIPGMDNYEGTYYYIYIIANAISLLAAALLLLGLTTNKHSYFRPWIVLSLIGPVYFFLHILLNLFFFNFFGVSRILLFEGLPILLTLYCVYTVYTLYCILILEEVSIPVTVDNNSDNNVNIINTLYGTNGVSVTNGSNGFSDFTNGGFVVVTDPARPNNKEDLPPSYEELATAHKEHIRY